MRNLLSFVLRPALVGLAIAVALLALTAALPWLAEQPRMVALLDRLPRAEHGSASAPVLSYSEAIRRAAPAVVSINSQQQVVRQIETYDVNNPFRTLYLDIYDDSSSLGSGVIISPDGYIITSYHIFDTPGTEMLNEDSTVTLYDGRTVKARRLLTDKDNDLALLKVDEEDLPWLGAASGKRLEVGDVVLAIGNPRNIGQSVSLGIISALLRRDDSFVIQTDAAINPGNSGGALIDAAGNLIGINSTIVSASGGSEGIGFATPASEAIRLMERYVATGRGGSGPSGYLGIDIGVQLDLEDNTLTVNIVEAPYGTRRVRGMLVHGVFSNGPAEKAGISCGDLVTAIDGISTDTEAGAIEAVKHTSSKKPGETLVVEVFRQESSLQIPVVLGVGEPELEFVPPASRTGGCMLPF